VFYLHSNPENITKFYAADLCCGMGSFAHSLHAHEIEVKLVLDQNPTWET
jgi:site-specific DNA-cytosine methylase